MARYKKRQLAYWGIDYIKAIVTVPEKSKLNGLSKNSNQIFLEFLWQKIDVTLEDNNIFSRYFVIRSNSISIWFCGFNSNNSRLDFIEITGQALTIFGKNIFYFLFSKLWLEFIKFNRFDVCFDMFLDVNYFYDTILDDKYKNNETVAPIRTKKNWLETIYFWKRDRKVNSYLLTRIYNKILDSKKKDKLFLYSNYKDELTWKYKDVTRFEVEVREDVAKFWDFDSLKDDRILYYRLVKSFWKMNVQFFKFLKDKDFLDFSKEYNDKKKNRLLSILNWEKSASPMNKTQERIMVAMERKEAHIRYWNDFLNDSERVQCVATMQSMAKRLFWNGYSIEKIHELIEISCIDWQKTPDFPAKN